MGLVMAQFRGVLALFALLVWTAALGPPANAATPEPLEAAANARAPIYIFRGGLDIFSTGMNTLAKDLTDKGIPAVAENFMQWKSALADIVKAYKAQRYPIVIIGHSYGANTALLMAYELEKEKIPVALLVFYDLTDSGKAPANVKRILNFRSSSSTGINVSITGGAHFSGKIENITRADLNHITIDKQDDLHKQTIETILRIFGRGGTSAAAE